MPVIHIHPDLFKFLERTSFNVISQVLCHQGSYILPNCDFDWVKKESDDLDTISFIPKSKSKLISHPDPYRDIKVRVKMKIGRFVSRVMNPVECSKVGINDKILEEFVNLCKSYYSSDETKLKIIEGDEILKYYDQDIYGTINGHRSGTLWSSCMRYKEKNKFMEIYAKNPKDCKMLIYMDDKDQLRARALLWENAIDKYGSSYKIMDRIYGLYDHDVYFLKEWASKNGYLSKTEQTSKTEQYFTRDGKNIRLHLYLKLENYKFKFYPYFDTFKFYDPEHGTFANSENFSYRHYLVQNWGGLEPEQRDSYVDSVPDTNFYNDENELQDPPQNQERRPERRRQASFSTRFGEIYWGNPSRIQSFTTTSQITNTDNTAGLSQTNATPPGGVLMASGTNTTTVVPMADTDLVEVARPRVEINRFRFGGNRNNNSSEFTISVDVGDYPGDVGDYPGEIPTNTTQADREETPEGNFDVSTISSGLSDRISSILVDEIKDQMKDIVKQKSEFMKFHTQDEKI